MDAIIDFLSNLESGLSQAANIVARVIEYVLFIIALILAASMIIVDNSRNINIGFNFGKYALITFLASIAIALAKQIFNIG